MGQTRFKLLNIKKGIKFRNSGTVHNSDFSLVGAEFVGLHLASGSAGSHITCSLPSVSGSGLGNMTECWFGNKAAGSVLVLTGTDGGVNVIRLAEKKQDGSEMITTASNLKLSSEPDSLVCLKKVNSVYHVTFGSGTLSNP